MLQPTVQHMLKLMVQAMLKPIVQPMLNQGFNPRQDRDKTRQDKTETRQNKIRQSPLNPPEVISRRRAAVNIFHNRIFAIKSTFLAHRSQQLKNFI